ncbi:MAG: reverse transcriptase/maturase family protein [Candidatus Peribacteraceae bacterium]|nr:reverse transcriptase/maturase family protein [Candidatus Peribacteraceae bacterium]MDD5742837.1 reverse transcriptase/maturase family protein [Candidatus Peribacteraceae bacterium]
MHHRWKPSPSTAFVVTKPKIREIFAAPFRDRIVHHLLYNHLVPVWEPKFVFDSYACRTGKGTHRASVERLPRFLRKASANGRKNVFCFQGDIQSFFTSMSQDVLYRLIEKHVRHPDILWLANTIIFADAAKDHIKHGQLSLFREVPPEKSLFHAPRGKGLPIGNITSQFFANVYLNELDQFVKHRLKAKYYLRYVDDFLLLHEDAVVLNRWREQIAVFLRERLSLTLHPRKQRIFPVRQGIDFLGYVVWPSHVASRRRVVHALKNKLWHFNRRIARMDMEHPTTLWTPELCAEFRHIFAAVNSYFGLFKHADTFRLRRHIYEKHFGVLQAYLLPADAGYSHFAWNEG